MLVNYFLQGGYMAGVTLGIFDDRADAEAAIAQLRESGFDAEETRVVVIDTAMAR